MLLTGCLYQSNHKMEINITKKLFIETIEELKKQVLHDRKCGDAFEVILPHDFTTGYNNSWVVNQLVKLLKVAKDDNHRDSWIEYYMWELNFGEDYKDGAVTENNKNIPLKTPEDLWNILKK